MSRLLSFILLALLIVSTHCLSAQPDVPSSPSGLRVWQGGLLPDGYVSGPRRRHDTFTFDGKRYGGFEIIRKKDFSSFREVRKELAPRASDAPSVFMRGGIFRQDTAYVPYLHDFARPFVEGIQIFSSKELKSLRKCPPFELSIRIERPGDSVRLYRPGEKTLPRSEETISLAELQKEKAPETKDRPCIFQYENTLIGEGFDRYRVPRDRAVAVQIIPSESFRELKDTGTEFYILHVTPFE